MSVLNLGLQSVGLMRTEMNGESEKLMSKCGTMNEIHKVAEENSTLKGDLIASLQAPINLVCSVFNRQFLKDEPFETFTAALETEMERFWETIQLVDDSVTNEDRTTEHIKQKISKKLIKSIIYAKKTLITNYLPLFKATSATIFRTLLYCKALFFHNKKMR